MHTRLINHHFHIPQLNRHRTTRVFLPKNYHQHPERRFPVIYLHDGQNLFDGKTAAFQHWKLQERMDRQPLYRQAILVGIDHGGIDRVHEYAPFMRGKNGGQGDQYLQFIAGTLKPFIDYTYRTWPHREATGMTGSSMGGLISWYAAMRYSHIFGKVGVFSPSLWFNPKVTDLVKPTATPSQIYLCGSRTESSGMGRTLESLYWKFKSAGYTDEQFRVVIPDRGKHNEVFWGKEFNGMYEWLFPRTVL
jgi:predicted alpha/beta superfamily hydrolase